MKIPALLCALVVVSTGTSARTLSPQLSAFEGDWAQNCDRSQDEGFAVRYSFEFLRSGGSIKFDDGVDLWWRGTVTAIDNTPSGLTLTYSTSPTRAPSKLQTDLLADGHLKVSGPDKKCSAVLRRCAGPRHETVEKLPWQQISALTPSRSRFVYFVKPGPAGCRNADEYLHFDLIGPAAYSVWNYGNNRDEFWNVERASDDNGVVRLELSRQSERKTISVAFPDSGHIRVEPWHKTFLRCEE